MSAALPGPVQTNQRAELMAVVKVVEACGACPTDVRTDSQYVHRRALSWAQWRFREPRGSHQDLWARFDRAMQQKADGQIIFRKVKGHATWGDVRQGRSTRRDKVGNAMADWLAVQGATRHESALPLVADQEARQEFIRRLQRMYLNILAEQSKDTNDIEEAMTPNVGAFVSRCVQKRRNLQVDRRASTPGPKRRRTRPAPGRSPSS